MGTQDLHRVAALHQREFDRHLRASHAQHAVAQIDVAAAERGAFVVQLAAFAVPHGPERLRNAGEAHRLLRDIDRDLKKKTQATLADLRARLRAARAAHQEALKGAVTRCRERRLAVREKLQAERAQALAELRAKGDAERGEARGTCALDKGEAPGAPSRARARSSGRSAPTKRT